MRTERVTLEITHKSPTSAAEFLPRRLWWDRKGESVRVVEDEERQEPPTTKTATTENDYVPPAPVSRPSETRQTQAERVGGGWWLPKYDKPSAPPPPRGWLTKEERKMLAWVSGLDLPAYLPSAQEAAKTAKALLARSTPPEVRLPLADLGDRLLRDSVIHALAEAGVAVKEVGE
jgi:hypothetical protein